MMTSSSSSSYLFKALIRKAVFTDLNSRIHRRLRTGSGRLVETGTSDAHSLCTARIRDDDDRNQLVRQTPLSHALAHH